MKFLADTRGIKYRVKYHVVAAGLMLMYFEAGQAQISSEANFGQRQVIIGSPRLLWQPKNLNRILLIRCGYWQNILFVFKQSRAGFRDIHGQLLEFSYGLGCLPTQHMISDSN